VVLPLRPIRVATGFVESCIPTLATSRRPGRDLLSADGIAYPSEEESAARTDRETGGERREGENSVQIQ
jgi:hypothetical protein